VTRSLYADIIGSDVRLILLSTERFRAEHSLLPLGDNDDVRIGDHDRIEIRSSPCHGTQEDVDYVDGRRLRDKPKGDSPAADLSLHR